MKKLIDITQDGATFVLAENFEQYRNNQIKMFTENLSPSEFSQLQQEQSKLEIHE